MNKNYQYFIYLTDHALTKPLIYKEYQLKSSEMIYKTIQEPLAFIYSFYKECRVFHALRNAPSKKRKRGECEAIVPKKLSIVAL